MARRGPAHPGSTAGDVRLTCPGHRPERRHRRRPSAGTSAGGGGDRRAVVDDEADLLVARLDRAERDAGGRGPLVGGGQLAVGVDPARRPSSTSVSPTSTVTRWAVVARAPSSSSAATSTATRSALDAGRRRPAPVRRSRSSSTSTPTSSRRRSVSRASASTSWSSGVAARSGRLSGGTPTTAAHRRVTWASSRRQRPVVVGFVAGARAGRRRLEQQRQLAGPGAGLAQLVGRPRVLGGQGTSGLRRPRRARRRRRPGRPPPGRPRPGGTRPRRGAGTPCGAGTRQPHSAATATTETRTTTTSSDVSDRRSAGRHASVNSGRILVARRSDAVARRGFGPGQLGERSLPVWMRRVRLTEAMRSSASRSAAAAVVVPSASARSNTRRSVSWIVRMRS